jgi:hypothetical protein
VTGAVPDDLAPGSRHKVTGMLFELRQYWSQPGRRDDLVVMMETEIIPLQTRHGIAVVGSFVAEDDPDHFIWMRRFDSEAHRAQQYASFYECSEWLDGIAPRVRALLVREKMQITRMNPTSTSALH